MLVHLRLAHRERLRTVSGAFSLELRPLSVCRRHLCTYAHLSLATAAETCHQAFGCSSPPICQCATFRSNMVRPRADRCAASFVILRFRLESEAKVSSMFRSFDGETLDITDVSTAGMMIC